MGNTSQRHKTIKRDLRRKTRCIRYETTKELRIPACKHPNVKTAKVNSNDIVIVTPNLTKWIETEQNTLYESLLPLTNRGGRLKMPLDQRSIPRQHCQAT